MRDGIGRLTPARPGSAAFEGSHCGIVPAWA
jgi:hypothetical protein